jgi:hypothetical protein
MPLIAMKRDAEYSDSIIYEDAGPIEGPES